MESKVIDLTNCPVNERNGTYSGMATFKEGITYNNEYWIVKYPKSKTMEISEFIGSQIYKILGYDVSETIIGYRNNKIVVACKDFCKEEGSLIVMRNLMNVYNKELEEALEESIHIKAPTHSVDLDVVLIHLDKNPMLANIQGIKERFWECIIIDGFINNNKRKNDSWGLLNENGQYNLAPIFDNDAAFYNKLLDSELLDILSNADKLKSRATGRETIYSRNGHKLSFKEILELDNMDLKDAIKKVVPKIENHFDSIKDMIYSIAEEYEGQTIISPLRKEFCVKELELRLENMLVPAFKGELNVG